MTNLYALLSTPLAWDVGSVLKSGGKIFNEWAGYAVVIIGVIVIIASIYNIGKYFMSHGQSQTNIVLAIVGLLIGGGIAFGGWQLITAIAKGGSDTIGQFGQTILPYISTLL